MNEQQLEKMIALAAAKLKMSPDELKKNALSGNVDGILSKMDKNSADKVKKAMADKKLTDELAEKFKKDQN